MENTTKSKSENENYWGYILFSALTLICTLNSGNIYNWFTNENYSNQNTTQQNTTIQNESKSNTKSTSSYCSLSSSETYNYLIDTRSFTLNGNGSVRFTKRFDHARDKWIEDKIIITSGNYRLEGTWQVKLGNLITIKNYRIISGSFDASNNSPSRGMLKIECNGNLKGVLHDRNGNMIDILIKK
ncbi:hypothetical protein [uncultured Algibacter sp.]|uniref:hypothetical protein n=1 Tax=uncultured Algibacter sp. TaxID=298659 RepID=UPI002628B9C8|nr:hypothetical protein [uncultured Algibacter sp.]